MHFIIFYGFRN